MVINSIYNKENSTWIIELSGELDLSCADNLKNELNNRTEEKFSDVVVDMKNLNYIDSTGVGVIVGAMKKLRQGGKDIKLLNAKSNVKKIFEITGLNKIINMEG